jgi:hypothetical protein
MSLSALHSFFLKISTPPVIAVTTLASALLLWLIQFHGGVPGVVRIDDLLRIGLPDMMLTYSPSTIYRRLVQFGGEGRHAYRLFLERVDFIFPAVYGLFFVSTTTRGFSRLFRNRPALQKLSLLPFGVTLFDYAENLCFLAMLRAYPHEFVSLEKIANLFTLAKWLFALISTVLVLLAVFGLVDRAPRQAETN